MKLNNKGMALPLVLVIMLVLGLLGAALLQYSVADATQVAREANKLQAHYAARAGADAMADFLIENPSEISSVATLTGSSTFASGSVNGATFQVDVNTSGGVIEVVSVGTVNGIEQSVKLIITENNDLALFTSAIAQTYKNPLPIPDLDLKQMNVTGGAVESTGKITNFSGPKIEYSTKVFPSPAFPTNLAAATFNGSTVQGDRSYITIDSNHDVTVLTGGTTVKVLVDTLDIKGDIIIDKGASGSGRVELYVENSATLQTPKNYGDNPSQFIIYLAKGATLEIRANGDFNGYIYGPEGTVIIQSDQTNITGAVVARIVGRNDVQGPHGNLHYVPLSSDEYVPTVMVYKRSFWSK